MSSFMDAFTILTALYLSNVLAQMSLYAALCELCSHRVITWCKKIFEFFSHNFVWLMWSGGWHSSFSNHQRRHLRWSAKKVDFRHLKLNFTYPQKVSWTRSIPSAAASKMFIRIKSYNTKKLYPFPYVPKQVPCLVRRSAPFTHQP